MDATSVSQDQARPEDQPKPQEPVPTHRGVESWLLWLFITPIIYVLSIGPAAKLDRALHITQNAPAVEHVLDIIYSPMVLCGDRFPPLGKALHWYLFTLWKV
jgi:hypothetical protein